MLKLTVSPGEYLLIGEDIKIIFTGGQNVRIPIVIDAPKDKSIIRSSAGHVIGFDGLLEKQPKTYLDPPGKENRYQRKEPKETKIAKALKAPKKS